MTKKENIPLFIGLNNACNALLNISAPKNMLDEDKKNLCFYMAYNIYRQRVNYKCTNDFLLEKNDASNYHNCLKENDADHIYDIVIKLSKK